MKKIRSIIPFFLMFIVMILGTAFASIGNITGTIEVQAESPLQEGVFISDAEYYSNVDADTVESKINTYVKRMLSNTVVLSKTNGSSSITYKVKLYNNTSQNYAFIGLSYDESFYDNTDIEVVIDTGGIQKGGLIKSKEEVTIYITFKYKDGTVANSNELNSYINFEIGPPPPSKPVIDNPSNGNWTNSMLTITATSSTEDDRTQIDRIEFSYDNVNWSTNWGNSLERNGNSASIKGGWYNNYNTTIWFRAVDNLGQVSEVETTQVKMDITAPTVSFGTNGSTTWAKSHSTTVTVSDSGSGVNTSSLKYAWTQSTSTPAESSFSRTFSNGGTITGSVDSGNNWYLWVIAKDNAGNTTITRTNAFYLDNIAPTISLGETMWYDMRVGTDSYNLTNGMASGTSTSTYKVFSGRAITMRINANEYTTSLQFRASTQNVGNYDNVTSVSASGNWSNVSGGSTQEVVIRLSANDSPSSAAAAANSTIYYIYGKGVDSAGNIGYAKQTIRVYNKYQAFVVRAYYNILDRMPDDSGEGYWTKILYDGYNFNYWPNGQGYFSSCGYSSSVSGNQKYMAMAVVQSGLLNGEEYNLHSYNNTEHVRRIYRSIMFREPDSGGLSYHAGLIGSSYSRQTIIGYLGSTTEAINAYTGSFGIQ